MLYIQYTLQWQNVLESKVNQGTRWAEIVSCRKPEPMENEEDFVLLCRAQELWLYVSREVLDVLIL